MTSLIALVCEAHRSRGVDGPYITLVDGLWAYCAAGRNDGEGHVWHPIEPTNVEIVRVRSSSLANAARAATS